LVPVGLEEGKGHKGRRKKVVGGRLKGRREMKKKGVERQMK
jgi:hypothetical protein